MDNFANCRLRALPFGDDSAVIAISINTSSQGTTMNTTQGHWIRSLLMGASIVALSSAGSAAYAQDAQADDQSADIDEVIVTGFKSSLKRAQDIKYDSDTFVDAITAEDIGALPDRSVAEALQRVPGVNIGRFAQANDPDRFSVEGTGVVIRGLPFVRSELNGRDIFSANGGRVLSFNDLSPEMMGAIEVFKNTTADMVDGGIAGTVNLKTRKPLDTGGLRIAATVEGNYGDLAEEWSPAFSGLIANTWETGAGTFGLQAGYAQSALVSRTDASQITDPCYRAATLDSGCIRVRSVNSGGVGDFTGLDASTFPPADAVIVPKGAGVRTTTFDRDREAVSLTGQWESNDGKLLGTIEYLSTDASLDLDEYSILALVNDDALFPTARAGETLNIQNGRLQSGILTQAGGIPTENLRFQNEAQGKTEDLSFDFKWSPTDRLQVNFEAQKLDSDRTENGFIAAMRTSSDIFVDLGGDIPNVQFLPVGGAGGNQFADAGDNFYWFAIDNQTRNTGEMTSLRADVDYDFGNDESFFKSARFGARWADRNRVTKSNNFSTWGALSIPWSFNGGPGGAVYADNATGGISGFSQYRNPFADFQRGEGGVPTPGGGAFFFGGDNLVQEYLSGATEAQAVEIYNETVRLSGWNNDWGRIGEAWGPAYRRGNAIEGTPFVEGEISDVDEKTEAVYGRLDFGSEDFLDAGMSLSGNLGLRYVKTELDVAGALSFPTLPVAQDGEPAITQANFIEVLCARPITSEDGLAPAYCGFSPERQAEYVAALTGESVDDSDTIFYEHWLPSFNAKLNVTDDFLVRLGISKGISRPDLNAFSTSGTLGDNTRNLRQSGTLDTGPLYTVSTGNRLLKPVESINFDLSGEWYFDEVGSLTVSAFRKNLSGLINYGPSIRTITSDSGASVTTEVLGSENTTDGVLWGLEAAYQQTYDFLPGFWSGMGVQASYTYVNADDLSNSTNGQARSPFSDDLALAGVSENTVNFTGFYENDKISARLAYNWRSDFVITPRDVIFPYSPIIQESTGQLDGSLFYTVTEQWKVGVQAVNLLDEVTQTSQILDFDGTTAPRSAFRNDRRYSLLARFEF